MSLGNYDPHAKNLRFSGFFYLLSSIELHFKTAGPFNLLIGHFNIFCHKNGNLFDEFHLVPSELTLSDLVTFSKQ